MAGVWERLGRVLVPEEARPVEGGLAAVVAVGQGDRGLLLGGAGEEALFLGFVAALEEREWV